MAVSIGPKIGIDGEAQYRKELNNIIQSTKTLDKQMQALESSFDDETDAMEANQKQTDLLKQKAEKLTEEIDKMQDMVDRATEKYGEGSTEAAKWEASLASAQTELNNTNTAIKEHEQALEDMQSPMGELTQLIQDQETELANLQDQYANAYLEDNAEQCDYLADRISSLSDELSNNKARMQEAQDAAAGLADSTGEIAGKEDEVGANASTMASIFGGSVGTMANALVTMDLTNLLQMVAEAAIGIGESIAQSMHNFEEAEGIITQGTGLMGEDMRALAKDARDAWKAVAGDGSIQDTAAIVAALNTRLGLTGEEATTAATLFGNFAKTAGVDGTQAVNDIVDVMKQWGIVTGDANTDNATMLDLMNKITRATQLADVSFDDVIASLRDQKGAYSELGYSMDDAIGLMVQYRDSGHDVSEISAAMRTAVSKLSGEVDDLPGAWQDAIKTMQSGADMNEILATKIGDTDITIEQAFGRTRAQGLITSFQAMTGETEEWTNKIVDSDGAMMDVSTAMITTQDGLKYLGKQMEATTGISGDLIDKFAGLTGSTVALSGAGSLLAESSARDAEKMVKSAANMESGIYGNLAKAQGDYANFASSANRSIDGIRKSITLEAHGSFPNIASSMFGGAISWGISSYLHFAKGYDQAMVLKSPTVFGMVGGDRAGNEIVVGENHLMGMFTSAVRNAFGYVPVASGPSTTNNYGGTTVNVYGAPGQSVKDLANEVGRVLSHQLANKRSGLNG